jgi:hypothetical protein
MLIRAIALSIALLVGVGVILPLATETTEAGPHHSKYKRHHHRYRKYSKAWWRQYHRRQRHRRALAARRRALRLQQLRLAEAHKKETAPAATDKKEIVKTSAAVEPPSLLPSGEQAPAGWKKTSMTPGELKFGVSDSKGQQVGSASISIMGPAMAESNAKNTLGGVPVTSLRRDVINRMIGENGWVVNDFQKDLNGKKVYVVVAQSQNGGHVSSRMFYFTEVNGRIYSVSTTSNLDSADRLSDETEKVINSLQNGSRRSTQRAALNE